MTCEELRADLAANDGSNLVGFTQPGSGSVSRTVQGKLRERFTPQDYGAVGDGATNDSTAFINMLAAHSGFGVHSTIVLPPGEYRIAANLTINAPLIFEPGAILRPGGGITLTINGTIEAPDTRVFNISNGASAVVGTFGGVDRRISWWGATGDGTTDDSDELIAAIAAGGTLYGKAGATYRALKTIEIPNGTTLDLNGATIDGSAQPSQGTRTWLMQAFGSYGTRASLTANAPAGTSTISTATFAASNGDMVIVFSQARFDPDRTNTRVGEIAIVRSVAAGTIKLEAPLRGSYQVSDVAEVVLLNPKSNITIRNGTVIASSLPNTTTAVCAFEARVAKNVTVENVIFRDAGQCCVRLTDALFSKVLACHFSGSAESTNLAYGISVSNCTADTIVMGNSCYNRRHFISTNNYSTPEIGQTGVVRRVKFQSNVLYRTAEYAAGSPGDPLDTHAAAEDIEFIDNTVYGSGGTGVNFEARSGVIRGNRIYNVGDIGIRAHNESAGTGDMDISGNYVENTGDYGILVTEGFAPEVGYGYRSVRVCDNTVHTNSANTGINVFVNVADSVKPRVTVSGNTVTSGATAISASLIADGVISGNNVSGVTGISVTGASKRTSIVGNSILCTSTTGRGILTQGLVRGVIASNVVTMPNSAAQPAIDVTYSGSSYPEGVAVVGNSASSIGGTGISLSNNATYCTLMGNVMRGFATPINLGTGVGNIQSGNIT